MSDLLLYSIMHNPQCIGHNNNTFPKQQPQTQISLPPLSSLLPPIHNYHYHNHHHHHNTNDVILPPPSNYTTAPLIHSGSITPTQNHHPLTESNLIKQNMEPSNGLGLLTSAISSLPSCSPASSVASMSSPSSPNMKSRTKRRQRLGPSCDSCRLRKVKCDADIIILAKQNGLQSVALHHPNVALEEQLNALAQGQSIPINEEYNLIVTNDKLIKFKSCHSCNLKQLPCCFSKGFTKEDIMSNKRSSTATSPAMTTTTPSVIKKSKPVIKKKALPKSSPIISAITQQLKPITPMAIASVKQELPEEQFAAGRKSSCISCRKRKVRCVYNATLNKCEGCNKKKSDCVYDKQK
ncbi:uncharacterized protein SPAPADRAFT_61141 [Spathaspora passalidarum NRRL Y-27907]|uniref:Zn(2)-C6 fungal-type domain-containing protein n=1 Tax=Spathaspora passalidarum (strain NRRL Y-27907 / 11-Y1) TaxID=619300 RepID=G3AP13_SPAPN|nr:uncharacterized protein SPAPADRAFT_61141 [Spathaspora passalidarum NRRL Y-27907]EGW32044.1 hypothetical protein SPAPADRAFT_61141 [Spathaspora passalidarum NRRL Y-27907]